MLIKRKKKIKSKLIKSAYKLLMVASIIFLTICVIWIKIIFSVHHMLLYPLSKLKIINFDFVHVGYYCRVCKFLNEYLSLLNFDTRSDLHSYSVDELLQKEEYHEIYNI